MTSTLYRHGVVHSSADPFAEALLVVDGVVAWVGADDTADGMVASADVVVDLEGRLLAPAFVDAHAHVLETGLALDGVDLSAAGGVRDLAGALAAVAAAARTLPPGVPVLGTGWDEGAWPEGRPPTAAELDAAAGGRPVYLARVDVHSAVVSTALAAASGADRLPGWEPSGRVRLAAHVAARTHARAVTPGRRAELVGRALALLAARGVVAVHEHGAPSIDTREGLAGLLAATADPASGLPLVVGYRGELCADEAAAREVLAAVPGLTGLGGDLNVDGSLGSRTAALREPYADLPPDAADRHGTLALTPEAVAAHLVATTRAGVQAGFHVIGDAGADAVLAGMRLAAAEVGAPALARWGTRLEHAEMVDAATLAGLLPLGARFSVQPAFDAAWGGPTGMYAARLGADRAAGLNPLAAMAEAGAPLAFGSDSPVTPVDPWGGVAAALRHRTPASRMSARAAFRAHTRGGWRAAGLDGDGSGELRVGCPAHLAVWDVEALAVQSAPGRFSSWSTDARAGTPLLPDLSEGAPAPVCRRTVRAGRVLFDTLG
ncbi:amidohydrolase [Cellulomonas endophytica]|uniref:amidohydrolase n=1 Tax=Cellulomonas endophytica TaxID=2494735 RepID=UPI00196BABF1|nr:amidohydrolase family protein [Cellulomonas endophytica]